MSEIRVNTISEKTSANGVAIDSLAIKDGKITNLMNATLSAADLGTGVHIKTADSGASVDSNADELVVEGSGSSGISILSGTGNEGAIKWGDSGDNNIGFISYDHAGNDMYFGVNAATRMFISDAGNVGIGTTSPTNKLTVQDGSYKVHLSTQSSDPTIHFTDSSNSTSDGVLKGYKIKFKTDSSTTMVLDQNGNLDVKLGNIVMSTAGKGIDFSANTDTGTGESVNDSVLDDYEQGTFTITPTTTGTDFTTSSKGGACFYTKIGDWVYCNVQWFVSTPSGTASSGNFKLTGMPFVCNAGGNSVNGTMASFGRTSLPSPRHGSTYANISDNSSEVLIYYQTSGGSSTVFEADNLEGNITPFGAFSIGYPCD